MDPFVAMNDTALPVAHGFPARMVIPGLYGYVSATKWVTDIEVTTFADATAYWATRGCRSQQAPIKPIQDRRARDRLNAASRGRHRWPGWPGPSTRASPPSRSGSTAARGMKRGWPRSPTSIPGGSGCGKSPATPAAHLIEARATDKTGYTQTAVQAQPAPNGASGYPSAAVTVRGS